MSLCEKLQCEREEAREEGRAEGRKEGREEGREEGRLAGILESLHKLIESGMPEAEARRILQIPDTSTSDVSTMNLQ